MLFFGHLGITLGAAVLGSGVYGVLRELRHKPEKTLAGENDVSQVLLGRMAPMARHAVPLRAGASPAPTFYSPAAWIERLQAFLDIRFLLIGSLLPDIIDKPVGDFVFRSTFGNGRIFSHTLLFFLVLLVPGLVISLKWGKRCLLALAVGALVHLILDFMWYTPQTLFWPLLGWGFPKIADSDIIGSWLNSLVSEPAAYIPEIIGFIIVGVYGWWVVRRWRRRVRSLW